MLGGFNGAAEQENRIPPVERTLPLMSVFSAWGFRGGTPEATVVYARLGALRSLSAWVMRSVG